MDNKTKAIIKLISVGLLFFCLIIIHAFIQLKNDTAKYIEKKIIINDIDITYPYFGEKEDAFIESYLETLDSSIVDEIRYEVSFIDTYTNLIFKSYSNNIIVNYYSILFDEDGNYLPISHIITNEIAFINKIKDYIANSYYSITEEEIDSADMSLLFKDDHVDIFLTNYNDLGNITLVILNYQEIQDYISIKIGINDNIEPVTELPPSTTTTQPVTTVSIDPNIPRKPVAFTFDDGPSSLTVPLLNILDEYNAKATFFVLGNNMRNNPGIIWETVNRGHEIANHTTGHRKLTSIRIDEASREIEGTNSLFNSIVGRQMELLRPPYGSINQQIQQMAGMPVILWSVDSRDWESRNTEAIISTVLATIQEGDIVIFHDLYPTTIEAIRLLLPILYADNYEIVSVTELFNRYEKILVPGEIYRHAR